MEGKKKIKWVIAGSILAFVLSLVLCFLPAIVGMAEKGEDRPWLEFLGNFHPLVLHTPIGVLMLVGLMEVVGWFSKSLRGPQLLALLLNAASAFVAVVLGLLWYYSGKFGQEHKLLDDHLLQGIIYGVVSLWLPLIYIMFREKKRFIYTICLFGAFALLTSASHLGGEATHGDLMAKAPWNKKEVVQPSPTGPVELGPVVYTELIAPIFEQKCYRCHHSTEKKKSRFIMDTVADIIKGGSNQDEMPALTPGDATKSSIITTIHLPIDDDLHMPPEDEEQITSDELALLTWWVNEGASETAQVGELNPTEEIKAILAK